MTNIIEKIFWGKDTMLSGLIALAVVGTIALGCNCTKGLDLNTNTASNTASDNPFGNSGSTNGTSTTRAGETKPNASKGTLPSDGEQQYLIRETMLSFNNAIQTEDFTAFYNGVSKQLKKGNSANSMKSKFQSFIDGEANFGEIDDMTADISTKSTRRQMGSNLLDVKGEYDTAPIKTTFDLTYIAEGSEWKLLNIQIYTGIKAR